jgi:glycosyltransferase involved in cell wall biosynthesis
MKISIITICYNSEKTIKETIKSLLMQNYPDIEYLIIDGNSKDSTVQIAKSYSGFFKEKGIRYIISSEPDKGIYDAMNKGILRTTGDIIGILNSDDRYASIDVLSKVMESFSSEEIDSCYGNLLYIKNNKPYRYWKSGKPRTFRFGWMPPHPTFFVKKSIYEKYGLFRLDCGTVADYELMLRFLEKYKISTLWIDNVFSYMEAGGASGANFEARKKAYENDIKAWEINNLPFSGFVVWLKKIRKIPQFIEAKFYKIK